MCTYEGHPNTLMFMHQSDVGFQRAMQDAWQTRQQVWKKLCTYEGDRDALRPQLCCQREAGWAAADDAGVHWLRCGGEGVQDGGYGGLLVVLLAGLGGEGSRAA